jgi:hypothetical protein
VVEERRYLAERRFLRTSRLGAGKPRSGSRVPTRSHNHLYVGGGGVKPSQVQPLPASSISSVDPMPRDTWEASKLGVEGVGCATSGRTSGPAPFRPTRPNWPRLSWSSREGSPASSGSGNPNPPPPERAAVVLLSQPADKVTDRDPMRISWGGARTRGELPRSPRDGRGGKSMLPGAVEGGGGRPPVGAVAEAKGPDLSDGRLAGDEGSLSPGPMKKHPREI